MADGPFGDQQDQRPVTITLDGPVEVKLINELITALQTIVGPGGDPVSVSGTGAGSISMTAILQGRTIAGADEPIGLENSREVRITLHGEDEAGNIDPLRTDPGGILWMRAYEDSVIAPPVILPAADGILWNPAGTAAELYEIDFLVVNNAGALTGPISVGIDIGAGGALAIPEFWMDSEIIPFPGTSGWRGSARQGFLCRGADTIRGWNGAGANLATIHFRIRRIDTNV